MTSAASAVMPDSAIDDVDGADARRVLRLGGRAATAAYVASLRERQREKRHGRVQRDAAT